VSANAVPPKDDMPPGGLRPQFRLITLFLLLTLVGLIFAAFQYIGAIGTFALILAILVVTAHVSGNAIGTALRDGVRPKSQPRETASTLEPAEKQFAPITNLGESRALGRPIYFVTAISSVVLGVGGITLIKLFSTKPISIPNTIAGAIVLSGLGAFWTFVTGSFLQVAFGAFLHALRQSNSPPENH
jgi:hypothetical protein